MEDEKKKDFLPIGCCRTLNIEVYSNEKLIFKGMVEEAPENIKNMRFCKIEAGSITKFYVDEDEKLNDLNENI